MIAPDPSKVILRQHPDYGLRGPGDQRGPVPGETLVMEDGSMWFHPYAGGAPTRVAEAD